MADIVHQFPIAAAPLEIFAALSTPEGLSAWWTLTAEGEPVESAIWQLGFGPGYDWKAVVSRCEPQVAIEYQLTTQADADWVGTRVGFELVPKTGKTEVLFRHSGWPEENAHYRTSCFCWAMYLRLLKRYVEAGEFVAYGERLDA